MLSAETTKIRKSHLEIKGGGGTQIGPTIEWGNRIDDTLMRSSKRKEPLWLYEAEDFIDAGAIVRIVADEMHSNDSSWID